MPEVVLITGCSTGLGRDLANACLKRGLTVIASARKRSALEELEHKGASVITLDVTVGEEQLEQFAKEVISKLYVFSCSSALKVDQSKWTNRLLD